MAMEYACCPLHDKQPGGPPPAVIFNSGPAGLAVARSLGKRGIPIVALDKKSGQPAQVSRYTAGVCTIPDPIADEDGFIQALVEVGQCLPQRGVLFPCGDEWMLTVTRHRERLAPYYYVPAADHAVIATLLNKATLYEAAAAVEIPVSPAYDPRMENPYQIAERMNYPCILRPAVKQDFTSRYGSSVALAYSSTDLLALIDKAPDLHLLVQEQIPASTDNLYTVACYLDREQQARGTFVGLRKATYPAGVGTSCLVEPAEQPALERAAIALLQHVGYTGIAEVEFMWDPRDSMFKLLDVNPRPWKWVGLPIAAGVDLPWLAYQDALGHVETAGPAQHDVTWISTVDYVALRAAEGMVAVDDFMDTTQWTHLFSGQTADGKRIVDSLYTPDDPVPFLAALRDQAAIGASKYRCGC